MGRAGSTVRLEGIQGGRQAGWPLKKEIHLEERQDRHIPAERNPVTVSEIQFWPAKKKEVRQQGCRQNPGPVPGMLPVKLYGPLPQSQWASADILRVVPEPPDKEVDQTLCHLFPQAEW